MNKARMKTLNDSLGKIGDGISFGQPWAGTEILCGYGYHHSNDPFALSYLEEEIFEPLHNTVPVSGVQTILELAFGVSGNITIPTLYTAHGIGLPDDPTVPTYLVPENSDTLVQLQDQPFISQVILYSYLVLVLQDLVRIMCLLERLVTVKQISKCRLLQKMVH